MSLTTHYIETARALLENYKGELPFPNVLKNYFSQHKKYGSRDRKVISNLCYSYFRLGRALLELRIEERMLLGLFFCGSKSSTVLKQSYPKLDEAIDLPLLEKESIAGYKLSPDDVFPWLNELSESVDATEFALSHLRQPDLFLRIRPGYKTTVLEKLNRANFKFELVKNDIICLTNSSNIDTVLQLNKEVVVQDRSSQQTGKTIAAVLNPRLTAQDLPLTFWDACAASGGKSIMLHDLFQNLAITASDIRSSILANLKTRFHEAGIRNYEPFVADLSVANYKQQQKKYQLVLTDVPCTGSGTWARTPEQLHYFNANSIDVFAAKQLAIATNAAGQVQAGGWLVYITCSVFKKENEDVVAKLLENKDFELLHSQLINGIEQKADSMFIAIMQKA